ncbi:hypothetical protein [Paenibacillus riograndensis]|uniref:hypothetical protein n=1 Tax=Paenibacillus riograndensis TaxID=483937 RepID=UPI000315755C|nr:hypothetical protein [Paenibacillus riograndensis]
MQRGTVMVSGIEGLQPEDPIKLLLQFCEAGQLLLVSELENYAVFALTLQD